MAGKDLGGLPFDDGVAPGDFIEQVLAFGVVHC
jgi:hypothetical protein